MLDSSDHQVWPEIEAQATKGIKGFQIISLDCNKKPNFLFFKALICVFCKLQFAFDSADNNSLLTSSPATSFVASATCLLATGLSLLVAPLSEILVFSDVSNTSRETNCFISSLTLFYKLFNLLLIKLNSGWHCIISCECVFFFIIEKPKQNFSCL